MPTPVWALSVDLQTKTATFTSGLGDAARAARGSFDEIKDGARDMGRETGYSMGEARHSVMMLSESFGIHLPRALASFVASLGPIGPALEAAFPLLAIVAGATLLIEHLEKVHQAGEKLSESQLTFGTTVQKVFNSLEERLLQVGIRTDELNSNHLAALEKQLKLIDLQTFNELEQSFDKLAKGADVAFAEMKASGLESFFQISKGSEGAKAALEHFKTEYESLLAQKKDKEAGDLLAGTLESAKKAKELMEAQQGGHGSDEKELQSQEKLIEILRAQISVREQLNEIASKEKKNDQTSEAQREERDQERVAEIQARGLEHYKRIRAEEERSTHETREKAVKLEEETAEARIRADQAFYSFFKKQEEEREKLSQEAGKIAAEHEIKMAELKLAASKEGNQLLLAQGKISAQELVQADRDAEAKEYQLQRDALNRELEALNQHDAEYMNRQQAINNKLIELKQQYSNKIQQIDDQAAKKQLADLRTSENQMKSAYAGTFSDVIMRKESFGQAMQRLDSQMASTALRNMLQSLMQKKEVDGQTRFEDARTSAADAFRSAGNPILGAIMAAEAFATVMAFEKGGVVPGVGKGDTVPAMLEPGEGVLTTKQMDMLSNRAKFGDSSHGGHETHVHIHSSPTIHALDSEGMDRVLESHSDVLAKHFSNHLRKMNK